MEATANRLLEEIRSSTVGLPGLRVFVIGEKHFLRVIDGRYSWSDYSEEYGYADFSKLDRGKILAAFAKMEFLVNECINLHLLGSNSPKIEHLAYVVRKLPFRQRIEAMKEYGLIGASLEKKLKKLSQARNFLAHEWDEKHAEFDGAPIKEREVFEKFRSHIMSAFEKLVKKYKELQEETDYKSHLVDLIEYVRKENEAKKP